MREALPRTALPIYATVAIARDVEARGTLFAAGTRGQIVDVHDAGVAYEVEFASPYGVVTLRPEDLFEEQ